MSHGLLIGIVLLTWTAFIACVRRENPSKSWTDIAVAGPLVLCAVGLALNYLYPWLGTVLVAGAHVLFLGFVAYLAIFRPGSGNNSDSECADGGDLKESDSGRQG